MRSTLVDSGCSRRSKRYFEKCRGPAHEKLLKFSYLQIPYPIREKVWRKKAAENEFWVSAEVSQCRGLRAKARVYSGFLRASSGAENVWRRSTGGGRRTGIQHSPPGFRSQSFSGFRTIACGCLSCCSWGETHVERQPDARPEVSDCAAKRRNSPQPIPSESCAVAPRHVDRGESRHLRRGLPAHPNRYRPSPAVAPRLA